MTPSASTFRPSAFSEGSSPARSFLMASNSCSSTSARMSGLAFKKFLTFTSLPNTAKEQLPDVLSNSIQTELLKRLNAEEIIFSAIDEINRGSVETMEEIIARRLEESR